MFNIKLRFANCKVRNSIWIKLMIRIFQKIYIIDNNRKLLNKGWFPYFRWARCCKALSKNIRFVRVHFSSSIIPCDTIKVPGWKDKKMIDRPFAWPLRNNLRCKWNVYCYFRKSLWNDIYTSLNRVLLKANVTDCVIKFICQENAITTFVHFIW